MSASIPVYSISLPEYRIEPETDWLAVGRKLDRLIETHFPEKRVAIRCIGLCRCSTEIPAEECVVPLRMDG